MLIFMAVYTAAESVFPYYFYLLWLTSVRGGLTALLRSDSHDPDLCEGECAEGDYLGSGGAGSGLYDTAGLQSMPSLW